MMDVAFVWSARNGKPEDDWYVFDEGGRTVRRGFPSKASAVAWIAKQLGVPQPHEVK